MTHLIDKDEIEKKINYYEEAFNNPAFANYEACLIAKGKYRKLLDILQFINSLEVKEVDLEKELKRLIGNVGQCDRKLAKHFFELGLKLKGE